MCVGWAARLISRRLRSITKTIVRSSLHSELENEDREKTSKLCLSFTRKAWHCLLVFSVVCLLKVNNLEKKLSAKSTVLQLDLTSPIGGHFRLTSCSSVRSNKQASNGQNMTQESVTSPRYIQVIAIHAFLSSPELLRTILFGSPELAPCAMDRDRTRSSCIDARLCTL